MRVINRHSVRVQITGHSSTILPVPVLVVIHLFVSISVVLIVSRHCVINNLFVKGTVYNMAKCNASRIGKIVFILYKINRFIMKEYRQDSGLKGNFLVNIEQICLTFAWTSGDQDGVAL